MIYYLMDTIYRILQKMIHILLGIIHNFAYPDKDVEVNQQPNKISP